MMTDFRDTPPEVESILGVVDTYLRWRNKNGADRGYEIYHPSAYGKCLRSMQYKRYVDRGIIKVEDEDFDSRVLRLFETGHYTQSRWEKYFEEIGILRGIWICRNPICKRWHDDGSEKHDQFTTTPEWLKENRPRIYGMEHKCGCFKPDKCACGNNRFDYDEVSVYSKEMNMAGHADIILDFSKFEPDRFNGMTKAFNIDVLPKNPIVVDMKTINSKGFDNITKYAKAPSLEYQIQLTIYANLLDCEYGLLIYECKDDSHTKAYKIPKNTDTWFALIKQQAIMMDEMTKKVDDNGKPLCLLPPPRPSEKSCYECRQCMFKKLCQKSKIWSAPDLEERRKKFYGFLLKE